MRLQKLQYSQLMHQPAQWTIEPVELDSAVLIVGKNSAGKSRTISILWNLANLLRTNSPILDGAWSVVFQENSDVIEYRLTCTVGKVNEERLIVNGELKLRREEDGTGELDASGTGSPIKLRFQIPVNVIAAVAKRDLLQHAYLEPLHKWASSVRYYPFGTGMGREEMGILTKEAPPADPSDWRRTLGLFARASKEFADTFKTKVLSYMERLGYSLESIDIVRASDVAILFGSPLPGELVCLAVKERELPCQTNQLEMSQGMFRALALMIHLAYAELSGQSECILLDDVGEGLDYERSTELIRLLLEIAHHKKVQVIMSTNDRFVMNAVPLENWAIIRRKGSRCEILTYRNSHETFEEFKLTGLSNFDMLSSGFFEQAPSTLN